jgi:hypothetical protein
MEDRDIERIEWQAAEYTHKERKADWFWALGLVALVICVLALWFHNYVFAIFVVVSGVCLAMFTLRHPQTVNFVIDKEGLIVGKDVHPWNKIKGFRIKDDDTDPKLLIVTARQFLPVYTISLPTNLVEDIRDALVGMVPEVEIQESKSMLFMEKIGF